MSAQQLRIAGMVSEGKENSEIAKSLGITTSTVSWRRKRIRNRLGIKNRQNQRKCCTSMVLV
ncbi:MAG: helix-turn-helix transcriptional regulator [Deltaproteobacteria bacterium]|nr:helix-turn-helix transcriptional regulator [Deltaproteobacteria bacterium]